MLMLQEVELVLELAELALELAELALELSFETRAKETLARHHRPGLLQKTFVSLRCSCLILQAVGRLDLFRRQAVCRLFRRQGRWCARAKAWEKFCSARHSHATVDAEGEIMGEVSCGGQRPSTPAPCFGVAGLEMEAIRRRGLRRGL